MKYANHIGYSDVNPFEIIRKISEKTLEIRRMKPECDPNFKPEFVAGGFSGHCANLFDQKWIINSDPDAPVFRIRLGKHGWKDANGGRYQLSDEPVKFYDYNF